MDTPPNYIDGRSDDGYYYKIKDVNIGFEDHGILTTFITIITLDEIIHQGFGCYDLRKHLSQFVIKLLETFKVERLNDLIDKKVRIIRRDGLIHTIGHVTEDRWFTPSTDIKWD